MTKVTTYYLDMKSPSWLTGKKESRGLRVSECEIKAYQLNRFLYHYVGGPWEWTDKLPWSDEEWRTYAESDNLRTWVAYYKGSPAGYYELQLHGGDVEIAYFGLAPGFIGRRFGGYLLTQAIETAWAWRGTKRVWVHTCTLDHRNALENYKARGMKVYRTETCWHTQWAEIR